MHPDVKKLLAVQEVDQRIAGLRRDLVSIPQERERRETRLRALESQAAEKRSGLQKREVELRSNEVGIKEGDQEIKKLQERLNTVKNNAEYQAILLQIESVKKQISELENEGLQLMEVVEGLRGELASASEAVAEERAVFEQFESESNELLAQREGEVAAMQGERSAAADGVPPELLAEYERMFDARSNLVVCPVEGATCTGCYISIPPNLQVKLRAGTAVVRCDACQRILYYPD
ncbi:MAG: hypothetical protein KDB80_14955 [Planctomycetes bacterium]|nr:hypothetical protein [Planctomycetota bacterium]